MRQLLFLTLLAGAVEYGAGQPVQSPSPPPPYFPGVPIIMPPASTGIFTLTTSDDAAHVSETYDQLSSGNFDAVYTGTWDGPLTTYTYYGSVTSVSCHEVGGDLLIPYAFWWSDSYDAAAQAAGTVSWSCSYNTYREQYPGGPISFTQLGFRQRGFALSEALAGRTPGACPASASEARNGISWMPNANEGGDGNVWTCVANCGLFACTGGPPPSSPPQSQSSDDDNLPLILGAALGGGGGVFLLFAIGIVCFCMMSKRQPPPPTAAMQPSAVASAHVVHVEHEMTQVAGKGHLVEPHSAHV